MPNPFSGLNDLIRFHENLNPRNIRKSHLKYFFPLVLALILLDQRITYFEIIPGGAIFGVETETALSIAFCLGEFLSLIGFSRFSDKPFKAYAFTALSSLIVFMLIPKTSLLAQISLFAYFFGLGGCLICAFYVYVYALCNAERFYGIVLVALYFAVSLLLSYFKVRNIVLDTLLPFVFTIALVYCIFKLNFADIPDTSPKHDMKPDNGIYVSLLFPMTYFILNTFGDGLIHPEHLSYAFRAFGAIAAVILALMVQLFLKRSLWQIINSFLIFAVFGILLMAVSVNFSESVFLVGSFSFGIGDNLGYILTFYMAGVIKRYSSYNFFRKINIFIVLTIAISAILQELAQSAFPDYLAWITAGIALLFLVLFMLLSPLIHKFFLSTDWIEDLRCMDIATIVEKVEEEDIQEHLDLTAREKEICALLLQGNTALQIAQLLSISVETVRVHTKHLYQKLNVKNRSQLFMYFINQPAPDSSEL